jgi:hypothetical protein
MSTDSHSDGHGQGHNGQPVHDDVAFEPRDIKASTIYVYLFVLAVAVIFSYVIALYVYRATTHMAEQGDAPLLPVVQEQGKNYQVLPPEPRLQGVPGHENDPQLDHRLKVAADNAANDRWGWIDQKNGIAQIPVREAMKIIAEKGLPGASSGSAEAK